MLFRSRESARIYDDLAVVLAVLLDRFFDMDYAHCVGAFESYVSAARLVDDLLAFYAWCDEAGVARSSDFPEVKRIDDKLLQTLEQFLRERGKALQSQTSSPPRQERARSHDDPAAAEYDMNTIKALPAPEHYSAAPPAWPEPAKAFAAPVVKEPEQSDLVDLRESEVTADEQGNKLALALFSGPPAANGADGGWVAFPSDDDAPKAMTSAWQTPAAEPGKADWELALVETASNLPRQAPAMGGGLDPLLLHGMYDQGAARQHVGAQASASGSASSVAVLPSVPILALPGPEGMVVGGDPFAASLAVPPPSYVQMAEMDRKQELLAQEQRMWAQYRQGGMQGQAGLNGLAVGGGGSAFASNTSVAMPIAYHGSGGYYY